MTDAPLPKNVYRLAQREFDAIHGSPWVYSVGNSIRGIYKNFTRLEDIAQPRQGLATADNFRFLRFWWEVGRDNIELNAKDQASAKASCSKWFPSMKGGRYQRWYGNQDYVVNWQNNGFEIKSWADPLYGNSGWSRIIKSVDYYFREGITWSLLSSKNPSFRWMKPGWVITHKGPGIYLNSSQDALNAIAILNSECASCLLQTISPNLGFETGQVALLPWTSQKLNNRILKSTAKLISAALGNSMAGEITLDFIIPLRWPIGLCDLAMAHSRQILLETQIDDEVYRLYGISADDRSAIKAELEGGILSDDEEEPMEDKNEGAESVEEITAMTPQELAVRWISYALGVVLGRFQPGMVGSLGSAIYRQSDFAIGSLPAPDEAEFDELVGTEEKFAYVDENGGRHVFSIQEEKALQSLALPDGIAVFDDGHPRDLPTLVEKALNLMLREQAAREVIREATRGDSSASLNASLRKFLEKDFFTVWHIKWYRKRPVYWPIQSSKRAYGFILFHEKITRDTFYAIQREPYLDTKRNAVALKMADLQASLARALGIGRKKLEKELDDLRKLSDELAEFAKELEAVTMSGYEPEPNWIDDGVILRMAPLWKVIPIWKSEPKKYWERLEAGDFDWSHIAMKYWPDRVRGKCKTNKSFAIAHGHEEWFKSD